MSGHARFKGNKLATAGRVLLNKLVNKTYEENLKWKERKNHKGCIYGLDTKITDNINKGEYIFVLEMNNDKNKIKIQRSAEMIYGLRNFIGNAIKFSKSKVNIFLTSDDKEIKISVNDDGPGFPKDIIKNLGEPYIKSRSLEINSNSGLGLGTFLGKTLLERQNAKLLFKDDKNLGGASVVISWSPKNILINS